MARKCPACGGRHATAADVRECMGEAVSRKRRDNLREKFGLK